VWPTLYGQPREARTLAGDGWLRSGDLGLIDSDANVTIVGRVTEVVHVGGFNVIPAEVESFLLTHPQVTSAAVLPIPHPSLGEALVAFVIPSPSNPPTPRELTAFCRRGISGYKVSNRCPSLARARSTGKHWPVSSASSRRARG